MYLTVSEKALTVHIRLFQLCFILTPVSTKQYFAKLSVQEGISPLGINYKEVLVINSFATCQ